MSETEISQTPEGPPREATSGTSPPATARPAVSRKPRIGDTRPAPAVAPPKQAAPVVPLVQPGAIAPKETPSSAAGTAPPGVEGPDGGAKRTRNRRRPGRDRDRRNKQVGRYLVCVHVQ